MELNKLHIFKSKYKPIKLVATEFDEPFYGFTLWRFRLYVENKVFNHQLLNYEDIGCGLFSNLDNFIFESESGDFLFIPYGLMIMNSSNYYLEKYKVELGANNHFIENFFIGNVLFVLNQRSIWILYLDSKELIEKKYHFGVYFKKMWREGNFVKFLLVKNQTTSYDIITKKFVDDLIVED